ncbi:APC family permease [Micromonospora sp. CPCC 205371]|nr:APC family permease [Micromonospora sp. CPCC 205371]
MWPLVFVAMAGAAPLLVVAGSATTGFAVTGFIGVPVCYLAVAAILAVFSAGYTAMARHIVNAGSFYAYVSHGLGKAWGVGAAFIALLAYNALQVSMFGAFGVGASVMAATLFGWSMPWWLCALAGWALVAVLGVRRVDLSGRVLTVLLLAEIAVVVVFDVVLVAHPVDGQVSYAALSPVLLLSAGAAALLVGGLAGFAGFEVTTVHAEEARDPRRTVPRATYTALAVIGVLYGVSAWAMTVNTGPDGIVPAAQEYGTELFFVLAGPYVPGWLLDAGQLLFVTSLFAALLAFHNTVSRYVFALGREKVLPARLGRTSRRTGAPKFASLTQSGLALGVVVLFAVTGWHPITGLFFVGGVGGGFGVLLLMALTSVAVVKFFHRHTATESVWRTRVAPILAALVLTVILAATVAEFAALLNVPDTHPLRWLVPGAYALALVAGTGWALLLRATRPHVWAAIGLGADAAATTAGLIPDRFDETRTR